MRRFIFAFFVASLVASNAGAAVITQTSTFVQAPTSPLLLSSFDPNLGTLNHVELMLSGQIVITVDTPPNLSPMGVPLPYQFQVQLEQSVQGQGDFDVGFLFDALYIEPPQVATGAGGVVQIVQPFLFSVLFDATTDLTGISFPSFTGPDVVPPVFGRREDFVSAIPGLSTPLVAVHELDPVLVFSAGPPVTPLILPNSTLNAFLLYDYTPAVTVSEPASALLLWLGLALLGTRRKKP
jgi:hypothetical protein